MSTLQQPVAPVERLDGNARGWALPRELPHPGRYLMVAGASVLLAAASLGFPASPSYDPWAWLIWGRQAVHLDLITTGGPTWKPLPVLLTTLFAPAGSAAPDLWLIVARAGGIMGMALAAWLAFRLATSVGARPRSARPSARGHDRLLAAAPALLAAVLALVGLAVLYEYLSSAAVGESEGLLVALVLLAVMRHLDGAPRSALALGFAAALIRPETWPFLAVYGGYLWRRDPGARKLIAALFAFIAALWFLPEVWGSGSPLRGVNWAQYPRAGSPAFARCPFCAELSGHGWPLLTAPFQVGVALALGAVATPLSRLGRGGRLSANQTAVLALGLIGGAWIVEEAVLTQMGFTGSDRYLLAPEAILIVVGAVGWAWSLRLLASRVAAPVSATVLVTACFALVAVLAPGRGPHLGGLVHTLRTDAGLEHDMRLAVERAGGTKRLLACGSIATNPSEAPLAAWTLGVPMRSTESSSGNVLIQSASAQDSTLAPRATAGYHQLAGVGTVRIYANCRLPA